MAKTVDNHSTLEDFRRKYNDLANEVGDKTGLRTENTQTVVDAINSIEDKTFFFQEFQYLATASQTRFTGLDAFSNTLEFRQQKIQVYKNSEHLIEGDDYTIGGYGALSGNTHSIIDLVVAASLNDKITIYAFTGSYLGVVDSTSGSVGFFSETAANTIYNTNDSGIILQGDGANKTTVLESGYNIQFAGTLYSEGNLTMAPSTTLTVDALTDGTLTIDGGSLTGASSIASTLFSGNLTGNVTGNVTGNLTGNVTGDLTGDVTGDLTGDVTGTVSSISNHSTTNLSEGTNQYFTNSRADARIGLANLTDLSNVDISSPSNGQVLQYNTSQSKWENAAAPETYNNSDVENYISGGNGISYSSGVINANVTDGIVIESDNIQLDYETVSSAPSSVGSTSTGHLWFVI